MKSETPILKVAGLNASFRSSGEDTHVLHEVSFELFKEQTLGIVGESGSGKSVTSLSIMRLIDSPPINYQSGEIHYSEMDVNLLKVGQNEISSLRGKDIAMIFQEPMTSLNPVMRCGKQITEMLLQHLNIDSQQAKKKTLELFEQVQLPDPERIFRSYPHELSGGQKQRVIIAIAISCDPKILIADEPTTALDVSVQREVLELLKELQKSRQMAMIFISHDLAVVSHIADYLVVMHEGKIVESGPARSVIDHPENGYTKGLLACRPPATGRPHRLPTIASLLDGEYSHSFVSPSDRAQIHKSIYSQEPIIKVKDLHTWYPIRKGILNKVTDHVKAVQGVSLKLYPGETLGVVGESGCGKSTLGRTIIGLEKAHSGVIQIQGVDITDAANKSKKSLPKLVQMIFQDPYASLDPRQSIGESILEPMQVNGIGNDRVQREEMVRSLLVKVGLEEGHYHRYPHEFSGGQRQRICIARALSVRPKVVICDESVSALDVSVQAQVLNLMNDLKEEFELSYVFISHDLSVVRYMSDRVMVMNKGMMVEVEEADKLYESPEDPYAKMLIDSVYSLEVS